MTVRGDKMKDIQWKKIIYIIFYCVLVIVFLWEFGHPALVKYMRSEVFLKISTSPADRSKIEKISLPAITFCASEVSSPIFQVHNSDSHHTTSTLTFTSANVCSK